MAEQRASDTDREQAADHLRRAGGDGRLTVEELGERVQLAYQARTRSELELLLADVAEERTPVRLAKTAASGLTVRPGEGGSRWVVAIMSAVTRGGHFRLSPRCTVLNVMGGAEVDIAEAELAAETVTVTVFSLMGGGEVYVPEDARVEISDFAFMGGNDVETVAHEPHDGPVIRLKLISIMGGTNVRRGSKAVWKERRRERRAARKTVRHGLHGGER